MRLSHAMVTEWAAFIRHRNVYIDEDFKVRRHRATIDEIERTVFPPAVIDQDERNGSGDDVS